MSVLSERYWEAVISSDPDIGKPISKPISVPIEVYATFNPVRDADAPETPAETLRRCRLELPGHELAG